MISLLRRFNESVKSSLSLHAAGSDEFKALTKNHAPRCSKLNYSLGARFFIRPSLTVNSLFSIHFIVHCVRIAFKQSRDPPIAIITLTKNLLITLARDVMSTIRGRSWNVLILSIDSFDSRDSLVERSTSSGTNWRCVRSRLLVKSRAKIKSIGLPRVPFLSLSLCASCAV